MKTTTIFCILVSASLVAYGLYLKTQQSGDAMGYILGGGIPLLSFILSEVFKKLRTKKL